MITYPEKFQSSSSSSLAQADFRNMKNVVSRKTQFCKRVLFKGTLDVHQASWQADLPDQLTLRSLSCYDCDLSEPCSHFTIGNLWKPLITKSKKKLKDEENEEKGLKKSDQTCVAKSKDGENKERGLKKTDQTRVAKSAQLKTVKKTVAQVNCDLIVSTKRVLRRRNC